MPTYADVCRRMLTGALGDTCGLTGARERGVRGAVRSAAKGEGGGGSRSVGGGGRRWCG
jgi:hypothetical protein